MILITGAGGTVGSEIIKQLMKANTSFRAAFHTERKTAAAQEKGIDAITIDFEDLKSLKAAFEGIDKLFLLAPASINQAQMELNAIDAATKAGVNHIVKLSVWEAGDEAYSFAIIHRTAEKAIESSGMAWTFIRPNSFMQNFHNYMIDSIRSEGVVYSATAEAKITHVDARDIAAVAVKALTEPGHEGKIYTLSGPEALTYSQIAAELSNEIGRPIQHINLSLIDLKNGMIASGLNKDYVDLLIDLERYFSEHQAEEITNDIKNVTGRDPISFKQYVQDYISLLKVA